MSESNVAETPKPAPVYVVKMLNDAQGVDYNKIHPELYKKGETYEIGESLYSGFKSMGVIELVKAPPGGDQTIKAEKDTRAGGSVTSRAELEKQAKKLKIKFNKDATDEELAEAIKAKSTEGESEEKVEEE